MFEKEWRAEASAIKSPKEGEENYKKTTRLGGIREEQVLLNKEIKRKEAEKSEAAEEMEKMNILNKEAEEIAKNPEATEEAMDEALNSKEMQRMIRDVIGTTRSPYGEGLWFKGVKIENGKIIVEVDEKQYALFRKSGIDNLTDELAAEMSRRVVKISETSSVQTGKKRGAEPVCVVFPIIVPKTIFSQRIELKIAA